MTPKGYQQITDLSAATALTVPAGTRKAVVIAVDQDVRYRDDATDPTADVGMYMPKGIAVTFDNEQLNRLSFIETTTSAELNIVYYG